MKTGTSQAYHDNWTVGYTPRVGVWVGNFDRRPLRHLSGVTGAAPIFQAVMLAAHRRMGGDERARALPDESLERRNICALSGEDANSWCPAQRPEWIERTASHVPCSWHHPDGDRVVVVWPAEYRDWARQHGHFGRAPGVHADRASGPAGAAVAKASGPATRPLQIANPPAGATYLIDPTLRREFQALRLKVVAPSPTEVVWTVNESRSARAAPKRRSSGRCAPAATPSVRGIGAETRPRPLSPFAEQQAWGMECCTASRASVVPVLCVPVDPAASPRYSCLPATAFTRP